MFTDVCNHVHTLKNQSDLNFYFWCSGEFVVCSAVSLALTLVNRPIVTHASFQSICDEDLFPATLMSSERNSFVSTAATVTTRIFLQIKVKVKVSPQHAMQAQGGSRGIVLLVLHLGSTWWATPRPLNPGKKPRYPFYRRVAGPQGSLDGCRYEKISCPNRGSNSEPSKP